MAPHPTLDRPSPQDLEGFRTLLLAKRRLLTEDLAAVEGGQSEEASSNPSFATHPADLGSAAAEADVNFEARVELSLELREVDDALRRLSEGSFGLCDSCREAISRARLEAIPYARLCLECRKKEEESGELS